MTDIDISTSTKLRYFTIIAVFRLILWSSKLKSTIFTKPKAKWILYFKDSWIIVLISKTAIIVLLSESSTNWNRHIKIRDFSLKPWPKNWETLVIGRSILVQSWIRNVNYNKCIAIPVHIFFYMVLISGHSTTWGIQNIVRIQNVVPNYLTFCQNEINTIYISARCLIS